MFPHKFNLDIIKQSYPGSDDRTGFWKLNVKHLEGPETFCLLKNKMWNATGLKFLVNSDIEF